MCSCCIPSQSFTLSRKTATLFSCSCNWHQKMLSFPAMGVRNRPIPVYNYFRIRMAKFCHGGYGIKGSHYGHVNRSSSSGSNGFDIGTELGFKEKKDQKLEFDMHIGDHDLEPPRTDTDLNVKGGLEKENRGGNEAGRSKDALQGGKGNGKGEGRLKNEKFVSTKDEKLSDLEQQEPLQPLRNGRQLLKRSSMLAKQVISIRSALSLGFVSQLWVDTSTWAVRVVEVRPNLLSSESERLLLEDIKQVGDVVLVLDESVMVNGLRMVGFETLVGYNVVTPGRQRIGKVRGYTFDIETGAVESLELDSFGISIIPSSLVTTYALFTQDVLEVVSDTIIVHEAAASRIQRLTKGLWAGQSLRASRFDVKYSGLEDDESERSTHDRSGRRKFYPGTGNLKDDWELPIDYL